MKGIKFAVGFAFVLATTSIAGNGVLFLRFNEERASREKLETRQVQLEDRGSSLESQVAQSQQEGKRLQEQIQEYADERDSLKGELDKSQKEIANLLQQVKDAEEEKNRLIERAAKPPVSDEEALLLNQEPKLESTLPAAIIPPGAKVIDMPAAPQPAKKIQEKKPVEESKKSEKSKKSAPPPLPAPPLSVPPSEEHPSQVLSVNRQFNFVVVNAGMRDRLKVGDTLQIEQGGKVIGKVQVEKLYENFSACSIVDEVQPTKIREGDLVRFA